MKKFNMSLLGLVLTMVVSMSMTSITVLANSPEDEVVGETTKEEDTPTYSLTPEGNLTLIDDVETDSIEDKQFITMQSKNGNYFYLIIDRAGDTDNVYFLNLVDEADLLALIEDEPQVEESIAPQEQIEPEPVEPTISEEVIDKESNHIVMLAIVGLFALIGGGVFYYFKFMNPQKAVTTTTNSFDDFEYDEDEEEDEYDFQHNEETMDEVVEE